jgi:hypothetical protein
MTRLLEAGDIAGIRAHMNATTDAGCHTMNASLERLLSGHKDQRRGCAQCDDRSHRLRRHGLMQPHPSNKA